MPYIKEIKVDTTENLDVFTLFVKTAHTIPTIVLFCLLKVFKE